MKMKIILIAVFLIVAFQTSQGQFVRNRISGTDTTGAVLDSLTRQYTDSCNSFQDWDDDEGLFNQWYRLTVATDDTCYISTNATFPSNLTFELLPNESVTFERYSVHLFPQVFIKSYSADIIRYRYILEGD